MLHWRLYYPDGTIADEPDDECSIGHAAAMRKDPAIVAVTRRKGAAREVIVGEPLNIMGAAMLGRDAEQYTRERGATPWRPVFYRKRSLVIGTEPQTDLVVFGRARENIEGGIDVVLFCVTRDGAIQDCPEWAVDIAACESLVAA